MTATTADLRESVAKKLRVKSTDMDLDDATASAIDDRIDEVTNYLRELGLIWWADDAIPDAALMPMTLMVAAWTCADFGKAGQGYEAGFADGKTQLSAIKPSAELAEITPDYF